ncbi:MAG: D-aminoacyl-tRNA deacylase, partial [Eubacteriales bacterium]|nr:D-aminoacyl-tRNA deacylase [Eubacteriales bacterium]
MRAVVTRVNHASVRIEGKIHGQIGKGLLVLLGVHRDDTEKEASKIADKICGLRIFEDEAGKMNLSPDKVGAGLLIISQFTLFADCRSRR